MQRICSEHLRIQLLPSAMGSPWSFAKSQRAFDTDDKVAFLDLKTAQFIRI